MTKKDDTTKKLVGIVCVLHGTFNGLKKCPICEGFHANGGMPSCSGGCGATVKQVRRFAFTAVVRQDGIMIGRADEGTRGYTPMGECGAFETEGDARKVAADLNQRAGLDERTAALIVVGTMHSRDSELVNILKRGLALMKQVQEGTADQDEVDEWADDARQAAQV